MPARAHVALFLLSFALVACGHEENGAIEGKDPLHADGIGLPPPAQWRPPGDGEGAGDGKAEMIQVRTPPFSSGIFPCSQCHVGGEPVVDEAPAMPHQKHLDREIECTDCHDPDETGTPTRPKAELCFECHENLEEETAAVRAYLTSTRQEDGTYEFPERWKTRDTIANHAGHAKAKVSCEDCHGKPGNTPFAKPRSAILMKLCMDCHTRRQATLECKACHEEIRKPQHADIVLKHAEDQRGCLDCHSGEDRDFLHLVNGTKVPFTESYRLCGQCHGPKLRDWKTGVHGKRTGMWDGRKEYLLCVHCHRDPHAPSFPKMAPEPPPTRTEDIR